MSEDNLEASGGGVGVSVSVSRLEVTSKHTVT